MIEILVTVSIVGLLALLLVPAVEKVKKQGYRAASVEKLRTIVNMARNYVPDHDGRMPPPQSTEWGGNLLWFEYLSKYYGDNPHQNFLKRPGDNLKWVSDQSKTRQYTGADGTVWNWSYALNASLPYVKSASGYTDMVIPSGSLSTPSQTMWFMEGGQNCYLRETQATQVFSDELSKGKTVVAFVDGHSEILDREQVTGPAGSAPASWPPAVRMRWMGDSNAKVATIIATR